MTAWISLPSTDTDADSPADIDLASKIIQRNQHLYEFYTGGARYSDRIPHDHAGIDDGVVSKVSGPNLLIDACPHAAGTEYHWTFSGFARDATSGTMQGGATDTDYIYQDLLKDETGTYSGTAAFGSGGAPLVLSFFCKATSSLSSGTIHVGITDGSTSTFSTGHRFSLPYTSITTSWKRFWAYLDDSSPATAYPGAGHSSSVRFLLRAASGDALSADVLVSGCMVCTSEGVLTPFSWTPAEKQADGWNFHDSGDSVPNDCPIFDTTVAMTNAVELTTRA